MPLFTVTMKMNRTAKERDRLSRTIHAASVVAGYPEDDLFQRFISLDPSDLRVDPYYPALPKPRSDQILMIEVLVSSGTDTDRKRRKKKKIKKKNKKKEVINNKNKMIFF